MKKEVEQGRGEVNIQSSDEMLEEKEAQVIQSKIVALLNESRLPSSKPLLDVQGKDE